MSNALYRLGRFAAVRPWVVIGAWLVVAISVVAASGTFGRDLEDSFEVPGLDSQEAIDLLSDAGSDRAGITAQVVVTPSTDGLTFDDPTIVAELAGLRSGLERLPNVLATDESIAPTGGVAVVRVQYPVLEDLSVSDLDNLKDYRAELGEGHALRVEMGGDLFFSFAANGLHGCAPCEQVCRFMGSPTSRKDPARQPGPGVRKKLVAKNDREHADHQAVDHDTDPQREAKNVAQQLQE